MVAVLEAAVHEANDVACDGGKEELERCGQQVLGSDEHINVAVPKQEKADDNNKIL